MLLSARSESQPETRQSVLMYNEKPRPGCSTSRSAADGQTTGTDKREVVSHVRTRSLDRLSPRTAGRANNRGSPVNDRVRSVMKNLEDYLPRKSRKKKSIKLAESPLYSPETLDALENAEKLIKEAQKKILEASYDVNSSPERELSTGSPGNNKTKDNDALYIRDIVATRFHEANESGRIFTRLTARPPIERFYRPELRQRRSRCIVENGGKIHNEELTISRRLGMRNKKAKITVEEMSEKLKNLPNSERRNLNEESSPPRISEFNETLTARSAENFENSGIRENQTMSKNFRVQDGPHVDIRNELTMTSLEKIDITPRPRSLPVQANIKTYEFRHASYVDEPHEARYNETGTRLSSREKTKIDEKSRDLEVKSSTTEVLTSNSRGSGCDLVENKSGRSIQPESLEGRDNTTRISSRCVKKISEKFDKREEAFMDFLQRAGNNENKLPDVSSRDNDLSIKLDTRDKIHIFDRAVQQFFHDFRFTDQADVNHQPVIDSADEKFVIDGAVFDKSDVSDFSDNFINNECFENLKYHNDNWNADEINLIAPNLGELDRALRKFDGSMDKVLRGARNLGLLMSEYSIDEKTSNPSKSLEPINDNTCSNDRESLYAVPSRDISSDPEINATERNYGKKDSTMRDNCKIIDSSLDKDDSATFGELFKGSSRFSTNCEDAKKDWPLKKIDKKKSDSHPRFSTPLNNDFKIGKSSGNNADYNSNEFANFFNGIHHREKNSSGQGSSRNLSKIVKINDEKAKLKEKSPVLHVATRNVFEVQKKIVLDEIERKCNLESLFNRGRTSNNSNNENRETVTFPICSNREKLDSATRSLIHDSAIGRETDNYEKSPNGMKLIDEYLTKKNSTKSESSAAGTNIELCQDQITPSKSTEFTRTKTLIGEKNVVAHESSVRDKNSEKLSEIIIEKSTIIPTVEKVTKDNSDKKEETKDHSDEEEVTKDKNLAVSSPGTSQRDRTSFDVSTVYSDDFEESTASKEKIKSDEKTDSPKNLPSKSISNEAVVPIEEETNIDKKEEDKLSSESSAAKLNGSKEEIDYLEKSISTSIEKSDEKKENKRFDQDESKVENLVIEEKGSGENNLEQREANLHEIEEKSSKDRESPGSSIKSTKVSRTSSLAEESRQDRLKFPENSQLGTNLIACSCLLCEGIIDTCNCRVCKICLETKDVFETSKDPIEIIFDDSPDVDEEKFIVPGIVEQTNVTPESKSFEKIVIPSDSKNHERLNDPKVEFQDEKKNEMTEPEVQFSKILILDETKKSCQNSGESKLGEIFNFETSSLIHSTPKKKIRETTCASDKFDYTDPDPIPSDDHASRAIETCTENYSDGELYLPSSCSYSLGEIRISELGTCAATSGADGVETSLINADGMRIFFSKSFINMDSSDNTINAIDSPVQSLGEVQETDVESTGSSREISSDGQHQRGKKYTIHS